MIAALLRAHSRLAEAGVALDALGAKSSSGNATMNGCRYTAATATWASSAPSVPACRRGLQESRFRQFLYPDRELG